MQDYRCAICREPLGPDYHVDHWVPLARGGTNDFPNIWVTHPRCNLMKGDKDPLLFMVTFWERRQAEGAAA